MTDEHPFFKLVKEGKIRFRDDGKILGFNEYQIILPVRVMNKLYFVLKQELPKKSSYILKELGKFQIKQALQRYVKVLGWKKIPKDKVLDFGKQITKTLGLGKWEFLKLNDSYKVIVRGSPLAEEFLLEYGKQDKPIDFYIAGIIESVFHSLLEKPMICKEVKCYAMGDSHCEFIVNTKEEIK